MIVRVGSPCPLLSPTPSARTDRQLLHVSASGVIRPSWPPFALLRVDGTGEHRLSLGSLFPALHRLADKGLIDGEWAEVNGRRVKIYALTKPGRAQLAREKRNWVKVLTAMNQALTEEA